MTLGVCTERPSSSAPSAGRPVGEQGTVAETPEGGTQMNLAAHLGFTPRERKENTGSPRK